MFNGVLERQDTTLGLGFITDIRVLLAHTDHDTLVTRTTNNGGEDLDHERSSYSTGSVITSKAGFAHTRTVINNKLRQISQQGLTAATSSDMFLFVVERFLALFRLVL